MKRRVHAHALKQIAGRNAMAGLPVTRSGGAAAFYYGPILYYGGECLNFPSRIAYDRFDAYNPKTDRWSPLAKAHATMRAQAGVVAADCVFSGWFDKLWQ
jgi:hypothetical protein